MPIHRPAQPHRGLAPLLIAPLSLALLGGGAGSLAAQDPAEREAPTATATHGRSLTFSPRSGPPGTVVTLRPTFLPAITPVQISIGGTRSGFEVLGQMMTDVQGELTGAASFRVPQWTRPDQTYVFMVLDLYFKPLVASGTFYVTGPDGTVQREGAISGVGTTCPALRTSGGELYSLSGDLGSFATGDTVVVDGTLADGSDCAQGTPLRVVRIRRPERIETSPAGKVRPALVLRERVAAPASPQRAPRVPASISFVRSPSKQD